MLVLKILHATSIYCVLRQRTFKNMVGSVEIIIGSININEGKFIV